MPATHLIKVDFPAPLSPTSAITSPFWTSKSTFESACTEPYDLEMPRSWRSPVSLTVGVSYHNGGWRRLGGASILCLTRLLLAVLRELADADLAPLQPLVPE